MCRLKERSHLFECLELVLNCYRPSLHNFLAKNIRNLVLGFPYKSQSSHHEHQDPRTDRMDNFNDNLILYSNKSFLN